jgi:hypothetical protein
MHSYIHVSYLNAPQGQIDGVLGFLADPYLQVLGQGPFQI